MKKPLDGADGLFRWLRSVEPQRRVAALASLSSSEPKIIYPLLRDLIDTPQELVSLMAEIKRTRGFGSGLKRALADVIRNAPLHWFSDASGRIVSFSGADSWQWKDVIKIVHPAPQSERERALYRYLLQKGSFNDLLSAISGVAHRSSGATIDERVFSLLSSSAKSGDIDDADKERTDESSD